jgi:hypothetical protein
MSSTFSTRSKVLALLGALLGLVSVGLGVQAAFSKLALASPAITSKPAAATTATTATFAFTGPGGATFNCRLDAATYSPCTSPKTYPGLAEGTHTFSVIAGKGADQSEPTTYTWKVDLTPPAAPAISAKPGNPSNSTSPSFSFTGAESGLTFQCALDSGSFSACTSPKSYSGLSQTTHTFRVKAIDAAGNQGSATSYTWTVDSTAPAAPVLASKPNNPTYNATNFFTWTGPTDGVSYQCSLENGAWSACSTPFTWVIETGNYGLHQFGVRSVDTAGNASTSTAYTFKYEKKLPTSGVPFQITGSVEGLTIDLWRDVHVTVTNPNSVTIYVSALSMAIGSQENNPDAVGDVCTRDRDLGWDQPVFPAGQLLAVGAGQSVTLPAQGVSAPRIRLKNLSDVNQESCKNASFDLIFSGTATN